jgi:hypothetical protein
MDTVPTSTTVRNSVVIYICATTTHNSMAAYASTAVHYSVVIYICATTYYAMVNIQYITTASRT